MKKIEYKGCIIEHSKDVRLPPFYVYKEGKIINVAFSLEDAKKLCIKKQ